MPDLERKEAEEFLSVLMGGSHHVPMHKLKEWGNGWSISLQGEMATFDFDRLTCLVFLAHDRAIRVSLEGAAPRFLRVIMHKRGREGRIFERHPTLDEAVSLWKGHHLA